MINDPIVDEIHRYRKEHSAQYGNDLNRIADSLREHLRPRICQLRASPRSGKAALRSL